MKPTAIPDEYLIPGATLVNIAVSEDQLARGIQPLTAIADQVVGGANDGMPRILIRLELEDGELEALHDNPHIWLSLYTHGEIPPFAVQAEETAAVDVELEEINEPGANGKPPE